VTLEEIYKEFNGGENENKAKIEVETEVEKYYNFVHINTVAGRVA
jgi:hypothetical protein